MSIFTEILLIHIIIIKKLTKNFKFVSNNLLKPKKNNYDEKMAYFLFHFYSRCNY